MNICSTSRVLMARIGTLFVVLLLQALSSDVGYAQAPPAATETSVVVDAVSARTGQALDLLSKKFNKSKLRGLDNSSRSVVTPSKADEARLIGELSAMAAATGGAFVKLPGDYRILLIAAPALELTAEQRQRLETLNKSSRSSRVALTRIAPSPIVSQGMLYGYDTHSRSL